VSAVKPEPLALEVTLAHYVASLPEGKSVALEVLARELGCSVEDLRRALESVMEVEDRDLTTISGVLIEDGRLVKYLHGGYGRDFSNPVRLSPVQGRAALLALDLVSKAVDPGILEELRGKVLAAVGREIPQVEADTGAGDVGIAEAIDRARREQKVLEIRYPSGGEMRIRAVEPLLMSSIGGVWYLNAYCRQVDAPRLFRLDRILAARVTEERFEEREGVDLKTDYEDIDPRGYAARRAVVRFSPEVARWMEERPELDLLEEHEDGSADYALYYTDPAWAANRIMQYLGEAVVLEPEELGVEVRRQASALLDRYENR
jgi:predicted DNA-binding transcriptional regulator YafY